MIAPIFFILLIFLLVSVPATVGWKLSRNHGQIVRMGGAMMAGQSILTPAIIFISLSRAPVAGENSMRTMIIYTCMALVISIMTFAVLEMKNTHKQK